MGDRTFDFGEAISFGWNAAKSNLFFFIKILISYIVVIFSLDILAAFLIERSTALFIILRVLSIVLQTVMGMGLIRIALRFYDNETPEFADLFYSYPLFFKYLIGSILYGAVVIIGFILLIFPGIYLAIMFQFFSYFIVDKEIGPIDALKRSSKITAGVKINLFIFGIILGVINLLGALALLVGLFLTVPTTMVAMAYVYRRLLEQTDISETPAPVEADIPPA